MFGFIAIAVVPKSFTVCPVRSTNPNEKVISEIFSTMRHRVFVYGTLKRNEPNHHWLTNKDNGYHEFLGNGVTTKTYPLIIATHYNIPFLLHKPGTGKYIQGDVYEVDDSMLCQLDILEDHPNFYVRELDDINLLNESTQRMLNIKCWVYFLKTFNPELIKLPLWDNYSSLGPHKRPYQERSQRDPKYLHELRELKSKDLTSVH